MTTEQRVDRILPVTLPQKACCVSHQLEYYKAMLVPEAPFSASDWRMFGERGSEIGALFAHGEISVSEIA